MTLYASSILAIVGTFLFISLLCVSIQFVFKNTSKLRFRRISYDYVVEGALLQFN